MKSPGFRARRTLIFAAVGLSVAVVGCASVTPRQTVEPEPVACANASLTELRAEHPDSLTDRARQQLQSLQHECSLARAAAARERRGWPRDHHMWWMGSGLLMTLMMLLMWSPW